MPFLTIRNKSDMTTLVSISDDLSSFIGSKRVALVVDTCSVIDILRIPQRSDENVAFGIREIEAAFYLIQESAAQSGIAKIILPHPVTTEIVDNRDEGLRELKNAILSSRAKLEIFSRIHQLVGLSSTLSAPEAELSLAGKALEDLVDNLVANSLSIREDSQSVTAAFARVVSGIAPSKKGSSQQMKDCAIVEHLLAVSPRLKDAGCERTIFISSNKRDFCNEANNLKEPLSSEFLGAGIDYVQRWQAAKALALTTS